MTTTTHFLEMSVSVSFVNYMETSNSYLLKWCYSYNSVYNTYCKDSKEIKNIFPYLEVMNLDETNFNSYNTKLLEVMPIIPSRTCIPCRIPV